MSTLGQHPSQQDAKILNQPVVTAETKRPSAERRLGNPTGRRDDEVPNTSRSRSTEVLGTLAAQIPSPEVPERPVQDTTLGGPHTHGLAEELLI